jgi:hypothetical protein
MPAILRKSLPNYVVVAGARRVLDPVYSADRVGCVSTSND